jgi:hypothetical protein
MFFPCLINQALFHYYLQASGGMVPLFLTSPLDGDEWLASRLWRFTPTETALGTHWIRVCEIVSCHFIGLCQLLQLAAGNIRILQELLRTKDHDKRSSAQTVSLEIKLCCAVPLAFEDPSAGGWDGYLQQIRYIIASARSYHVSLAPGWPWWNSTVPANSAFNAVAVMIQGID